MGQVPVPHSTPILTPFPFYSTEGSWCKIPEEWERGGEEQRDTHSDPDPSYPDSSGALAVFQAPCWVPRLREVEGFVSGAQVCLIPKPDLKLEGLVNREQGHSSQLR